jgi:hypothetical protein
VKAALQKRRRRRRPRFQRSNHDSALKTDFHPKNKFLPEKQVSVEQKNSGAYDAAADAPTRFMWMEVCRHRRTKVSKF